MKSLLAKFAMRKFVGLYLGEHEVSVSEVAVTPLGPVEVVTRTEPCPPNELLNVVERVLQSLQGQRKRRLQIAIGVPSSQVLFGTQPLHGGVDPTPEAILQKLLRSSDISADDLTIDLIKSSVERAPVASVAACRKKYMTAVLGVLEQCGAHILRTEPSPCALVRAAAQQHRPPRQAKTLLRIFLGKDEGLVALTIAGLPLAWRQFAMPAYSEGMSILSAARTTLSQSQFYGMETPLDYAIVHGRPDLHESLQKEGLPTEIGSRMIWYAGPECTGATTALGLALGCVTQNVPAFDLSRWMKSRASLRDIFPWGELVSECVLMVLMGLILARQSDTVQTAFMAAKIACAGNKILATSDATQLEKKKGELTKKLDSLHQFLDSRAIWTNYTREISACVPANIHFNLLQGDNVLEVGGKNKTAKKLQITAATTLSAGGAIPPAIGKFLASLRGNPLLKRDFTKIDLTAVQPSLAKGDTTTGAGFTITCQPQKGSGK